MISGSPISGAPISSRGESLQVILCTGIASAEAFGSATVSTGTVNVTTDGIASAEAFGSAAVSTGTVNVTTDGIASAEAFGSAAVSTGAATITCAGIASDEAFGTTLVSNDLAILTNGIASAEAFGTAAISLGAATITCAGIPSAEAFGTSNFIQPYTCEPAYDPGLTSVSTVQFTKGGDTVEIKPPEFNNVALLQTNSIIGRLRNGDLRTKKVSNRPIQRIMTFDFKGLTNTEKTDLKTFIVDYAGQEITFVDWESRTWTGLIVNDEIAFIEENRMCSHAVSIRFMGELVP